MTAYSGVSHRAVWKEDSPVEYTVLEEMAVCPICSDGDGDYPCEVCWESCQHHPNGTTCPICSRLTAVVPDVGVFYRPMIRFKHRAFHTESPTVSPEFLKYWDDWGERKDRGDERLGSWHTLVNGDRHPLEMVKTPKGYRCVCRV